MHISLKYTRLFPLCLSVNERAEMITKIILLFAMSSLMISSTQFVYAGGAREDWSDKYDDIPTPTESWIGNNFLLLYWSSEFQYLRSCIRNYMFKCSWLYVQKTCISGRICLLYFRSMLFRWVTMPWRYVDFTNTAKMITTSKMKLNSPICQSQLAIIIISFSFWKNSR